MKKLLILFSFFLAFNGALAATIPPVSNGGILPGPNAVDVASDVKSGQNYIVEKFVPKVVSGSVMIMVSLGIVMIIIAGLVYIFSAGDTELTQKAKDIIFWTLVGIGGALVSYALVKIIIGLNFAG